MWVGVATMPSDQRMFRVGNVCEIVLWGVFEMSLRRRVVPVIAVH